MRASTFSTEEEAFPIVEEEQETDSDSEAEDESTSDEDETTADVPNTELLIAIYNTTTGETEYFRVLADSGTSRSLGTRAAIERAGLTARPNKHRKHRYKTAVGTFETAFHATIRKHKLVELASRRVLNKAHVQVAESLGDYDFIFGRDYMTRYGIDLCFSSKTIVWDGRSMPMNEKGHWTKERIDDVLAMVDEPDVIQ